MDNLSIADVHGNMVNAASVPIEEQVARLCVGGVDFRPVPGLGAGGMGQVNAVFLINAHGKAGTVHAVR